MLCVSRIQMHQHVLVIVQRGDCRGKKVEVEKLTVKDNEIWNQNSSTRDREEKRDQSLRVRTSRTS